MIMMMETMGPWDDIFLMTFGGGLGIWGPWHLIMASISDVLVACTSNSAYNTSNSAYNTNNSAYNTSNSAYNTSNSAYNTSNSAYNTSNSAYNASNSAYIWWLMMGYMIILVGGIPTPLKNDGVSSSVGMMEFPTVSGQS